MIGCGTVGSEVARILSDRRSAIADGAGVDLKLVRVAVRDVSRQRDVPLDSSVFCDDPQLVVEDPDVSVVVEVMGGVDIAARWVRAALDNGKAVVTANKELIASRGPDLHLRAASAGVDLLFEAAVGGGIPIIRPIAESLAGEEIERVTGIVNGTTNYILTRMAEEGADFAEVLKDAQRLGFAEADPTADIAGHDAGAKAAILATLAFGTRVSTEDVSIEGITDIEARDIEVAGELGFVVKLLAIAEKIDDGVAVRVHPTLLPTTHPLASVRLSYNAVFVEGKYAGEMMFYGPGAGGGPTAMAVVGDVIDASLNLRQHARGPLAPTESTVPIVPLVELSSQYYLRLRVDDRPGVLGEVAAVFGECNVSIKSLVQRGREREAELVLILHRAREIDVAEALQVLDGLDSVEAVMSSIRVLGDEDG